MATDAAPLMLAIDHLLEATRRQVREARLWPIERRMTRALARAFRAQGRAFLQGFSRLAAYLPGPLDEALWGRYLALAQLETQTQFLELVREGIREGLGEGIEHGVEETQETAGMLGIRFDLQNPRAVQYVEERGAALVTKVDETTRSYIRTVIAEGTEDGDSYNAMAKRLIERYQEFAVGKPQKHIDSRAHLIAVTEVGEAYSHGNYVVAEGLRDVGLAMEKAWSTMGDDRVSDLCLGNEAAGWIPLDAAFPSGHMRPLGHVACRCDLLMRRVGAGG